MFHRRYWCFTTDCFCTLFLLVSLADVRKIPAFNLIAGLCLTLDLVDSYKYQLKPEKDEKERHYI